jgi:hypothetical protein
MDIVIDYVIETLDKALDSHTFTHLIQPVQLPLLTIWACLWNGKFTLPITLFEHFSWHFQHALHFLVSRRIYAVFE